MRRVRSLAIVVILSAIHPFACEWADEVEGPLYRDDRGRSWKRTALQGSRANEAGRVLRLRGCLALRSSHAAQDDKSGPATNDQGPPLTLPASPSS